MTIYTWRTPGAGQTSTGTGGGTFNFDPAVDRLLFNDGTIAAAAVQFGLNPDNSVSVTYGTKTVTFVPVNTAADTPFPFYASPTNISFQDGSKLLIGDGLATASGDNAGSTLTGTARNDQFMTFNGVDTVNAGDGNDLIYVGYANAPGQAAMPSGDNIDGGAGIDKVLFASTVDAFGNPNGQISVDLLGGTAQWMANGVHALVSLQNVEVVGGTMGNDFLSGGIAGYTWIDRDNGVAQSNMQTFLASGGWDMIQGSRSNNGGVVAVDYSQALGPIMVEMAQYDDTTWHQVFDKQMPGTPTGWSGMADNLNGVTRIIGSGFDDVLNGGTAVRNQFGGYQEEFVGGRGNDTINGGYGFDMVFYNSAQEGVTVDLAFGAASDGIDLDPATTGIQAGTDTLINIEGVVGSAYADDLTGADSNDFFMGGKGNDSIDGGRGWDKISFQGATSSSAAGVVASLATGSVTAGTTDVGDDFFLNIEELRGSDFDDTLIGGGVSDYRSVSGARVETFEGRAGNDLIDGGNDHGVDPSDNSIGVDYASYYRAPAEVAIDLAATASDALGTYVLVDDGYGSQDKLYNINGLIGSRFDDALIGNAENNAFRGGGGDDVIDGRAGIDTVAYTDATEGVWIDLEAGLAYDGMGFWSGDVGGWIDGGMDWLSGIENVIGSAYDDELRGDAAANKIWAGDGWDMLDSRDAGADTLYGGRDDDFYMVKPGDVVVERSGEGEDRVVSFGSFTIASGNEVEILMLRGGNATTGAGLTGTGNELGNKIRGTAFNDKLSGGDGDDFLMGGLGNDTLAGGLGTGDVVVYDDATGGVSVDLGIATVQNTGWGNDTITQVEGVIGSRFADTLTGKAFAAGGDYLEGRAGNDLLTGLAGDDTLEGGAGHDTLTGGAGQDDLTGGGGHDMFVFDQTPGAANMDTVTDFNGDLDDIQLLGSVFAKLATGSVSADNFRVGANPADGNDYLIFAVNSTSKIGTLYYDQDGNATGFSKLTIATFLPGADGNPVSLAASDFSVI